MDIINTINWQEDSAVFGYILDTACLAGVSSNFQLLGNTAADALLASAAILIHSTKGTFTEADFEDSARSAYRKIKAIYAEIDAKRTNNA